MISTLAVWLQNEGTNPVGAMFGGVAMLFWLAAAVVVIIGGWKMFEKAGHPGWAILIPFYNAYILLKIAGRPGWWLLLYLIPLVKHRNRDYCGHRRRQGVWAECGIRFLSALPAVRHRLSHPRIWKLSLSGFGSRDCVNSGGESPGLSCPVSLSLQPFITAKAARAAHPCRTQSAVATAMFPPPAGSFAVLSVLLYVILHGSILNAPDIH